jgi:hypothetical protein
MLGVMGLPVMKSLADAASTERMNVTMLSEAAKVTLIEIMIILPFLFP